MNSAEFVDNLVVDLRKQVECGGVPLSDAMWQTALACIGWPYVFGAWGALCTVSERKYRLRLHPEKTEIKEKCKAFDGGSCDGCKFFPDGKRTRCSDCRGFEDWLYKQFGFDLEGEGATGQWNTSKNWCKKGIVKDGIPNGVIVSLYIQKGKTMSHTGFYYNGSTIECSSGVQYNNIMKRNRWTHWAVAACFADIMGGIEVPATITEESKTRKTIRKGNAGPLVKECQEMLSALGFDLGVCGIDSDFGVATEKAVKAFQKASGLSCDGIVGPKTWKALFEAYEAKNAMPEEKYFNVIIPHQTEKAADEIIKQFPGARKERV